MEGEEEKKSGRKWGWMERKGKGEKEKHTKKLCSRLFSSEVRPPCVFETPFGGLRGNVR